MSRKSGSRFSDQGHAQALRGIRCESTDRAARRLEPRLPTAGGRRAAASRCRTPRRRPRAGLRAHPNQSPISMPCWHCRALKTRPNVARKRSAAGRRHSTCSMISSWAIWSFRVLLDNATVQRLRSAATELKSSSGEPGLDQVLAEIELRVEVELAKVGNALGSLRGPADSRSVGPAGDAGLARGIQGRGLQVPGSGGVFRAPLARKCGRRPIFAPVKPLILPTVSAPPA